MPASMARKTITSRMKHGGIKSWFFTLDHSFRIGLMYMLFVLSAFAAGRILSRS